MKIEAPHAETNATAIIGFGFGIAGLLTVGLMAFGWALSLTGITFGAFGIGRARRAKGKHRGFAIAGLALGTVGLLAGVALYIETIHRTRELPAFEHGGELVPLGDLR